MDDVLRSIAARRQEIDEKVKANNGRLTDEITVMQRSLKNSLQTLQRMGKIKKTGQGLKVRPGNRLEGQEHAKKAC